MCASNLTLRITDGQARVFSVGTIHMMKSKTTISMGIFCCNNANIFTIRFKKQVKPVLVYTLYIILVWCHAKF